MNASNAFRSHLMQQFAASARTQTRPPLALLGWMSDEEDKKRASSNVDAVAAPSRTLPLSKNNREFSSIGTLLSSDKGSSSASSIYDNKRNTLWSPSSHPRLLSSLTIPEDEPRQGDNTDQQQQDAELKLSKAFQTLLKTRRSSSHFAPLASMKDALYWRNAIERAVECGYAAPNHKRTEPCTFKRMISPSPSTEHLAEIAYHVSLFQQQEVQQATQQQVPSLEQMKDKAARKQEKWSRIPAFLVTLVESKETVIDPLLNTDTTNEYEPLPYAAPRTERDLEDYACACAATQNILLSLHSEHIASKWVTGPVIRTPAFRQLVQASPHDRVVSLIMIGHVDETKRVHRRRHRRGLDDVLVDL